MADTLKRDPAGSRETRDPRAGTVNQTASLTWITGAKLTQATLEHVRADEDVEWVGPVYRSKAADPGPQSYFAINPAVLLLTPGAAAAARELALLGDSATVDEARTAVLKSFVVLKIRDADAIDFAASLTQALSAKGITGGVKFENIPYLSPICSGCCGDGGNGAAVGKDCSPAPLALVPNDTFFAQQWGLQRINAEYAWPLTEGDPTIVVAVLDQGVELGHPDLNVWPISYSTITHTNDGSPVGNHGTACAGIIGGRIGNGLGVAGLAGKCHVMAIATNFADTEVAEGLYFAADSGARVVSMSFGVYPSWMVWDFAIIESALQYCQDKGVVLVAASGNENQPISRFPGSDPRTICVGGCNRDDVRKRIGDASIEAWWGACYGPDLDVVAPCLEIPTTDRLGTNGYTPTDYDMRFNGTSSATPHVAALAGLVLSLDPTLSSPEVRRIISQTCDKIGGSTYTYLVTAGKPYGTWNAEVGYGRINAERALLTACSASDRGRDAGPCGIRLPVPEKCCVSPCDPPWLRDQQCMVWYEVRRLAMPLGQDVKPSLTRQSKAVTRTHIEFRVTYEHRICLLGKQHGPLLYTVTLLPGETVTLYHSDRYRRITSDQYRYSVQTTFMQFLSVVHQARVEDTLDKLSERLASSSGSSESGGGFFFGLFGGGGESSSEYSASSRDLVSLSHVSEQFSQSVVQASQLTHAERSEVISTYEDKETKDITARVLRNANECRAVTYFVRKVVELYAMSTRVADVSYRIVAPNVLPDWHSANDLGKPSDKTEIQIRDVLNLLPKVGTIIERLRPISLPTDGTVYDPELAHCCSCEPERGAAIRLQLERQKAEALKACLEAQAQEIELQRRRLLLQKGDLAPFETPPSTTPV